MAKGREDFFCCLTMYLSRDGSLTQPSKKKELKTKPLLHLGDTGSSF